MNPTKTPHYSPIYSWATARAEERQQKNSLAGRLTAFLRCFLV